MFKIAPARATVLEMRPPFFTAEQKVLEKEGSSEETVADGTETDKTGKNPFSKERAKAKTPWERVQLARAKDRPVAEDYMDRLFTDFIEFHGDRNFADEDRKSVV